MLRNILNFLYEKKIFFRNRKLSENQIIINYESSETILDNLFLKFGSDKAGGKNHRSNKIWNNHKYSDIYSILFQSKRELIQGVIEVGIGSIDTSIKSNMGEHGKTGASLFAWSKFFPNAKVIGIDIDPNTLFQAPQIETYKIDQNDSESLIRFYNEMKARSIDIIVDDGDHQLESAIKTFTVLSDLLKEGGFYIIEDIELNKTARYYEYFARFNSNYVIYLITFKTSRELVHDNTLMVLMKK